MSGELPPLPPKRVINRHLPTGVALHGYNADDMRAYAGAAVAAARARSETAVEVLERAGAPKDRRKQATPERTKRMERALKVLSTWAEFPPLDAREVRELCFRALRADAEA